MARDVFLFVKIMRSTYGFHRSIVQTLELQSWSQILVHRVCLNFLCKQFLPYCLKVCFFHLLYLKTELNWTLWDQISHWYSIKRLHRVYFSPFCYCIFASLHHPCFGQIERLWDPSKWLPAREAPVSTLWICIFYPPTIFQISEIPIYMLMSTMERCHIHLIQSVFQNNTVFCFEIRKQFGKQRDQGIS